MVSDDTVITKNTKSVQIRSFPVDLWKRVKVSAAEMGVGMSEFVIEAVRRRLKELSVRSKEDRDGIFF